MVMSGCGSMWERGAGLFCPLLRCGVGAVVYCGLHKAVLLEGWVGWGGTSGPYWKRCEGQRILAWVGNEDVLRFLNGQPGLEKGGKEN